MTARMPTYFLSHGGGPWPYMTGPFRRNFDWLEKSLQDIPRQLPQGPKAILMVSGHWEAPVFTVSSSPAPGMLYDYSGFPEETYRIKYPAPGLPELAARVQALLEGAGLDTKADPQRGYHEGILENGNGLIRAFTANNNGIMLATLLFKAQGKLLKWGAPRQGLWEQSRPARAAAGCGRDAPGAKAKEGVAC